MRFSLKIRVLEVFWEISPHGRAGLGQGYLAKDDTPLETTRQPFLRILHEGNIYKCLSCLSHGFKRCIVIYTV